MFNHTMRWLRSYSAVLLLVIGLLMTYFFASIGFWSIIGPIFGVVIGSGIAVAGSILDAIPGPKSNPTKDKSEPIDVRIPVILASVYVLCMIVLLRFWTYNRPPLLYILFGGYAGIIAYQIARGERQRRVVPQILLLAFFTYWSSQFLFPAGMYGPDTKHRYIPAIKEILTSSRIPASETIYAGHLGYVAEFAFVSDLSVQTAYYLLATLVLTGTVVLLASLDQVLPAITTKMALYAALVFSITSWMLGRGMHPNKLNFFYPLILLLGIATIRIFRSGNEITTNSRSWVVIIVIASPAVIFGHQFSAGAAMIFLAVLGVFCVLCFTILSGQYSIRPKGGVILLALAFLLAVLGNPVHQGALLFRLSELVLSLLESGVSGGPGQYSGLQINILLVSTASQILLFALSILGAIKMFKEQDWGFDLVLFWMACISIFLVVAVLQNSSDTSPQRFYSLLNLFGFNICTGAYLYYLGDYGSRLNWRSVNIRHGAVAVLIAVLAVTSLASPIADRATSPVSDEMPHFRQFDTAQLYEGNEWVHEYIGSESNRIIPADSTVSIHRTGRLTGSANLSQIGPGELYVYSDLAERTGVMTSVGLSLGGRTFVFVAPPDAPSDGRVYSNGQTTVYIRQ